MIEKRDSSLLSKAWACLIYASFAVGTGGAMSVMIIGFWTDWLDMPPVPDSYLGSIVFGSIILSGIGIVWRLRIIKWREENPEAYAAKIKARKREHEARVNSKGPPIFRPEGVRASLSYLWAWVVTIGMIGGIVVGLYLAYSLVAILPLSVAIILGAIIIAVAVLVAVLAVAG